jgi:glyoxylase-like metal-dependent hydrolase (beta-lactamase superfamily II)
MAEGMILQMLTVGPIMCNCYIVGSGKTREGMIIDPGAEADVILGAVRKLKLDIVLIVATHSHIDHIAALRQVKETTRAPFAVHEAEAIGLLGDLGMMVDEMLGSPYKSLPKPDRLLGDGEAIEIGDLRFTVLHTPGHSPGGISLLVPGMVFCGDTLFNLSIGRTDLLGGSYETLMNSIFTKLMVLPDETKVLPGHGPESTIGFERKFNPFLR